MEPSTKRTLTVIFCALLTFVLVAQIISIVLNDEKISQEIQELKTLFAEGEKHLISERHKRGVPIHDTDRRNARKRLKSKNQRGASIRLIVDESSPGCAERNYTSSPEFRKEKNGGKHWRGRGLLSHSTVRIRKAGLYLIYAQTLLVKPDHRSHCDVYVNRVKRFTCKVSRHSPSESVEDVKTVLKPYSQCNTIGLQDLSKGDIVSLIVHPSTSISCRSSLSFWGLQKL